MNSRERFIQEFHTLAEIGERARFCGGIEEAQSRKITVKLNFLNGAKQMPSFRFSR
jgi:hypothetical protein